MKKLSFLLLSLTIALAMTQFLISCDSYEYEQELQVMFDHCDSLKHANDSLSSLNDSLKNDVVYLKQAYSKVEQDRINEVMISNASLSLNHYIWQNYHHIWNEMKMLPEFRSLDSLYFQVDSEDFFYHWGGYDND